jgi:hypothetical protein
VLKLERNGTKVEESKVRLAKINGMEIDSSHSLPSNIRRVNPQEQNTQRAIFGWKENIKANLRVIVIVIEGLHLILVKRGTCGGHLLTR